MELDDLKSSTKHDVASAARAASRKIAALMDLGNLHSPEGVKDPENGTTYYVLTPTSPLDALKESAALRKQDILILGSALKAKETFESLDVIMVSNDVNVRILGNALGLKVQGYEKNPTPVPEDLSSCCLTVEKSPEDLADAYYGANKTPESVGVGGTCPNQFVRFVSEGVEPQLFRVHGSVLKPVPRIFKARGLGIEPRNEGQRMAMDLLLDPAVQLVNLIGFAGTGKTYCALAAALAQLDCGTTTRKSSKRGAYSRIILAKPVVPMGRELGYLPGSEAEKIQPWMMSYFDNLDQLVPSEDGEGRKGSREKNWEQYLHVGLIQIQTLHSIRGRSLAGAFLICDEVQNLSQHEVKTLVSRAGEETKIVLCGDPSQIDEPSLDSLSNGLIHASVRLRGNPIVGSVTLTEGVRSPLSELAAISL